MLPARDEAERLNEDDQAARTEALFLADALARQAEAGRVKGATPGVCSNCGEACLPAAVYCDVDCRADHERRLAAGRRG